MSARGDTPPRLAYQPALDGLRGVAVTLVVVFHGGFTWMRGGYVGVSVFFTLSGYLITALLIAEHDRSGRIALAGFYGRRCKRLLPASLLTLAAVAVGSAVGWFRGAAGLRRDLLGSLFQVENWVKLLGRSSYADLTAVTLGRVGPLEHYWSLAVEEQFYWIWPVLMIVLLATVHRAARRSAVLVGAAIAGGAAAFVIAARWGADAAYWATPARLGEILVGAAVAGLGAWRVDLGRWTRWLALPALGVIAWASTTWPSRGGPAYTGWLPVFAVATAALIVALQQPSAVRTALSWPPLVWLGGVSYGVYLFHWPIGAALVDADLGWSRPTRFAVEVVLTLVLAWASAVLVERPVRRWSPSHLVPLASAALAVGATAVLIVAVVVGPPSPATSAAGGLTASDASLPPLALGTTTTAVAPTSVAPTSSAAPAATVTATTVTATVATTDRPPAVATLPVVSRPVRILVAGDSTAEATGVGLVQWAAEHPDVAEVANDGLPGCGFLLDGVVPTDGGMPWKATCRRLLEHQLPDDLATLRPDVVLLMVTLRDAEDRIFSRGGPLVGPTDPTYHDRLTAAYTALADRLIAAGVPHVVWVLAPFPSAPFAGAQVKMRDPARYDALHDVIRAVAASRPDHVDVVDLDGWMHALDLVDDTAVRPDGLHFTPAVATALAEVYLGPLLVDVAVGVALPPPPSSWPPPSALPPLTPPGGSTPGSTPGSTTTAASSSTTTSTPARWRSSKWPGQPASTK